MNGETTRGETRRYGRSAFQLSAALGLAGVLTYVFFGLASHSLSTDDYGEIVILWTAVFLVSATLFRPIEHLLARTLAERYRAGDRDTDAFRTAAIIQLGLCVLAAVAVVAAREPIQDNLFNKEPGLIWAMLGALVGYSCAYFARGLLAGRSQFSLYAAVLLAEVLVRLAAVVLVAAGLMSGVVPIGVGIALAPFAGLLVLPVALGRRRAEPTTPRGDGASPELTLGIGGTFTAAVLIMMLTEQVLINSGVLFVRAAEGAAAAGFINQLAQLDGVGDRPVRQWSQLRGGEVPVEELRSQPSEKRAPGRSRVSGKPASNMGFQAQQRAHGSARDIHDVGSIQNAQRCRIGGGSGELLQMRPGQMLDVH